MFTADGATLGNSVLSTLAGITAVAVAGLDLELAAFTSARVTITTMDHTAVPAVGFAGIADVNGVVDATIAVVSVAKIARYRNHFLKMRM